MKDERPLTAVLATPASGAPLAIDLSVLEAIPGAVYLCAADGVIVQFNRRAAELWGRSPALGDTDERFCGSFKLYDLDGKFLSHDRTPMATALRTGRPQHDKEVVVERPDGSRIVVSVRINALKDRNGRVRGAINCFQDITENKRVEDELRASRSDLEDFFENAAIAMHLVGGDGTILRANRAELEMLGYSREEYIGRPIAEFHADRSKIEHILATLSRGKSLDKAPARLRAKDGTDRDVLVSSSPRFREGKLVNTRCVTLDVTVTKRAEEARARHLDEQAALFELTDRLHRSTSLDDVYQASQDAILRALQCQRASILLFDESGVMRFVAWRGLSDAYRATTEGHSPWGPDAVDPRPICIGEIGTADVAEPLKSTIKAEGIGALAFVPLVTNGKLVGKFMSYYDAPHVFTESEVDLTVTIARQLGFGVDRMRSEEARRIAEAALRESEARERARAAELQTIMESMPAVMWIARDPDCTVIDGNPFSYEFLRLPCETNQSLSAPQSERPSHFQVYANGRALAPEELPVQRAARGEQVLNFEEETRFEDGTSRFLFGNATPLRDAQGKPCGAVAAFVDITDRKKAEQQRDLVVAELNHRVKNTLATVLSIAQQSFSRNPNIDEALSSFSSRLRALAQTHSRLAESSWSGASLKAMLLDEFAPYLRDDVENVRISGPPATLNARCALTLGMAIHELVTNAAKHGAFSASGGSVEVIWHIDPQDGQLRIRWSEAGGPSVSPPVRSGFGRLLLERALSSDLGGDVHLDFAEDGLKCTIAIPVDRHVVHTA